MYITLEGAASNPSEMIVPQLTLASSPLFYAIKLRFYIFNVYTQTYIYSKLYYKIPRWLVGGSGDSINMDHM